MRLNAISTRAQVALAACAGAALSAYALVHQTRASVLGETEAPCNISDFFSCDRVALSPFSHTLGLPQGIVGFAFFVAVIALLAAPFRRSPWSAIAVIGAAGSVYCLRLFVISVASIGSLCVNCIAVHLCCYAVTYLTLRKTLKEESIPLRDTLLGLMGAAACMASIGLAFKHKATDFAVAVELASSGLSANDVVAHANPEGQRIGVPVYAWNPVVGDADAEQTVIEFIDYTCPACETFGIASSRFLKKHPGKARFILKHFPQDKECNAAFSKTPHEGACLTAYVAQCAMDANLFEPFYERIFDEELRSVEAGAQLLAELGLDRGAATTCILAETTREKVRADAASGKLAGAKQTPTLLFDGFLYAGALSVQHLERLVTAKDRP